MLNPLLNIYIIKDCVLKLLLPVGVTTLSFLSCHMFYNLGHLFGQLKVNQKGKRRVNTAVRILIECFTEKNVVNKYSTG